MDLGKVRTSGLQAGTNSFESKSGSVISTAEMRQPQPAYTIMTPGTQDGISGLVIREMPLTAQDAFFEKQGIGTTQKPLTVMIGFQNEQIGQADHSQHSRSYLATIGHKANTTTTRAQQIATRTNGVIRGRKCCYLNMVIIPPRTTGRASMRLVPSAPCKISSL